jgi:hypothetical protein
MERTHNLSPCAGAAWGGKEPAGPKMERGMPPSSAQSNRNLLLRGEDLVGQPAHRVVLALLRLLHGLLSLAGRRFSVMEATKET